MLRSATTASESHERILTLPEDFQVRRTGSHWAVVGPTGLFLVGKSGTSPVDAAVHTVMGAHRLRGGLAKVLDVVPFVEPVVVTTFEGRYDGCAFVEADLLESFIAHGPTVVSEGELQLLRHHMREVISSIETDGGLC